RVEGSELLGGHVLPKRAAPWAHPLRRSRKIMRNPVAISVRLRDWPDHSMVAAWAYPEAREATRPMTAERRRSRVDGNAKSSIGSEPGSARRQELPLARVGGMKGRRSWGASVA